MFPWLQTLSRRRKAEKARGKAKRFATRGVWAPILVRGGGSHVIYDTPTTGMFVQKWLAREDYDCITFSRNFVGDRYMLKESKSDDTDDTIASVEDEEDKQIQLKVKERAKALPRGPGAFGGNHILINRERVIRGIRPLCREKRLDELAAAHAKKLASNDQLYHSSLKLTIEYVLQGGPCRLLGENVCRGKSAQVIHNKMMATFTQDRNNILDRRYTSFGVGSSKGPSGDLFIVQMYKG